MNLFINFIISLFFKNSFSKDLLQKLPLAPKNREDFIFSLLDYSDKRTRKMIRHLKTRNDFLLKKDLAEMMFLHLIDYLADQNELHYFINPLIIPIPISKKRFIERGFNQTHLLAKYFAKYGTGNYQKNIVTKNKTTQKQALIKNRVQRFKNVKNVFSIAKNKEHLLFQRDVILIDDLATTGATLLEIKKLLEKNGARNVIAITIAH